MGSKIDEKEEKKNAREVGTREMDESGGKKEEEKERWREEIKKREREDS